MVFNDPWRAREGRPPQVSTQLAVCEGQGGPAGKANDLQPTRMLAQPRCGLCRSGDDATSPEGPTNFVEGRRVRLRARPTGSM
jgi:hypothetical protein